MVTAEMIYFAVGFISGLMTYFLIGKMRSIRTYDADRTKNLRKEAGKAKIVQLLKTEERVVNDDVEQLLGVSHATASRYLSELEEEGRITQEGEEGVGVFYTLP